MTNGHIDEHSKKAATGIELFQRQVAVLVKEFGNPDDEMPEHFRLQAQLESLKQIRLALQNPTWNVAHF